MLSLRGVSLLVDALEPSEVRGHLETIAGDLHCNAVMLVGRDAGRLAATARAALDRGLSVHLRPDATDLRQADMLRALAVLAELAEALRSQHPDRVTLYVGSELSHTVSGVVPGPRSFIRLRLIVRYRHLLRRRITRRLNALLRRAVRVARDNFDGPLTYSAAAWEDVDWSVFDLVGVSLYRSAATRGGYRDRVRRLVHDHGKPFVVTEFGCGAYVGADDRGAGSFNAVNWFADPPRLREGVTRDESVQADYVVDLVNIYAAEGVTGCFVFTYAMPDFLRSVDSAHDLDIAGFALVTANAAGDVERKQAFHAVARAYDQLASYE